MSFGICPNCINDLNEDSSLMTKPSNIFKGNNVYLLCKKCQQVLLYNKDRDLIFDLDEYQNDEEVIAEINKLLAEIDNHYMVDMSNEPAPCNGNCKECLGCDTQYQRTSNKERRQQQEQKVEPEPLQEENKELVDTIMANCFLAINKFDSSKKKILAENELNTIKVDEWIFFELVPVTINAITTYEIVRHQ